MDRGIFQTIPIRVQELQSTPLLKVETIEDLDKHKISALHPLVSAVLCCPPIPDSLIRGSSRAKGIIAIV